MSINVSAILVLIVTLMTTVSLLDRYYLKKRRPKSIKAPVIVDFSRSLLPIFLIVLFIRSFIYEPFRIPSGSMMPTLQIGDFILVNKFVYGLRLPVTDTKIVRMRSPKRGEIAVFRYPKDKSLDYIKRIIGLPGDLIHYHHKVIYLNRKRTQQKYLEVYHIGGTGAKESGSLRFMEKMRNKEYNILLKPHRPDFGPGCTFLSNHPILVPEGHYFALGDNRDNSRDSRCWGLIPENYIIGLASRVWMHWDWKIHGYINGGRIGKSIK